MRRVLASLCVLAAACAAASPARAAGYVHRVGTSLADGNGQPLYLNGTTFAGALQWEAWMWGGGAHGESLMMSNLATVVGQARADRFREQVRTGFFTQADDNAVKAAGFNSIRLPFNAKLIEDPATLAYRPEGWAALDAQIAHAQAAGLYVILDMHAAPVAQNAGYVADWDGKQTLWSTGPGSQAWARTIALWRAIAARYATNPAVAGYDLLNEPVALKDPDQLFTLYGQTIDAIRAVDRNHMVWLEGGYFAHNFPPQMQAAVLRDPTGNVGYSFHSYMSDPGNVQSDVDTRVDAAQAAGVPVWVGEYGNGRPPHSQAEVRTQLGYFAARPEIDGRAFWTWKRAGGDDGNVIATSKAWLALVRYMDNARVWPKPSVATAEQGMTEFLAAAAAPKRDDSWLTLLRTGR